MNNKNYHTVAILHPATSGIRTCNLSGDRH